jgi:bacillithiol biosynthesis deacetylase BshB1
VSLRVLAIGAHPDDVELGVGGLLVKLATDGFSTGILDLSRGERASRGTPEQRAAEATAAAAILRVSVRENAGLPDGGIADTPEQRQQVAGFIRRLQPEIILAPMAPDRHPDHAAAAALVRAACFEAGLHRSSVQGVPFRPNAIYGYTAYFELPRSPEIVIDITGVFETKLDALRCYRSQFHLEGAEGPETYVSSLRFWENIRHRAAYWGHRVGVDFGEPLYLEGPMKLDLLPELRS